MSIDRLTGVETSTAIKVPCRVITTDPIALSGFQVIGSETLAGGDANLRVLVNAQLDPKENGIYDCSSVDWSRSLDFDGARDVAQGTLVSTVSSAGVSQYYSLSTSGPVVIGSSNISFDVFPFGNISSDVVYTNTINERTSGSGVTVDGLLIKDGGIGLADGTGASLIGFKQPDAGSVSMDSAVKLEQTVFAEDFGADPTGTVDSYAAIQAAITAVANRGGGVVEIRPGGFYKISHGLVSHKPVLLRSSVRGDVSSNTNGGGSTTERPTILYTGAPGGAMYTLNPAVVGDVIWGGGSEGIEWNGNDLADYGVLLDNTKYAVFDGKVRQVRYTGVQVGSNSGSAGNFSMKNHIRSLEFIWGTVAACQNAHGIVFCGNGSTAPATQQYVGDVSGLVYNGALIYIAETDNAQFQSVHAVVQSPGTGCAVFLQEAGSQPSNNNVFFYVAGEFKQQSGLYGNVVLQYVSEGGGITMQGGVGSSKWDGEVTDYVTGKRFKSHCYALRKKIDLRLGDFYGDTGTSTLKLGLQWLALSFLSSGTGRATAIIPPLYDVDGGVIEGVEIFVGTNDTSAGNYQMQVVCSTVTTGSSSAVVTPEVSQLQTVAAPTQYKISKYTFTFSPELAISNGNVILLGIDRLAADALDTNTGDSILVGARILYRGTGPDSSGSGTYFIPEW